MTGLIEQNQTKLSKNSNDLAIKDKYFPFKQFVNVTGWITLEMRLKPGLVQL